MLVSLWGRSVLMAHPQSHMSRGSKKTLSELSLLDLGAASGEGCACSLKGSRLGVVAHLTPLGEPYSSMTSCLGPWYVLFI